MARLTNSATATTCTDPADHDLAWQLAVATGRYDHQASLVAHPQAPPALLERYATLTHPTLARAYGTRPTGDIPAALAWLATSPPTDAVAALVHATGWHPDVVDAALAGPPSKELTAALLPHLCVEALTRDQAGALFTTLAGDEYGVTGHLPTRHWFRVPEVLTALAPRVDDPTRDRLALPEHAWRPQQVLAACAPDPDAPVRRDPADALERRLAAHWRWLTATADPVVLRQVAHWLAGHLSAPAGSTRRQRCPQLHLDLPTDEHPNDALLLVALAGAPGLPAEQRAPLLEYLLNHGMTGVCPASTLRRLGADTALLRAAGEARPFEVFLDTGADDLSDTAWASLYAQVAAHPSVADRFFTVRVPDERLLAAPVDALDRVGSGHQPLLTLLRRDLPQSDWPVVTALLPGFHGTVADLMAATSAVTAPTP